MGMLSGKISAAKLQTMGILMLCIFSVTQVNGQKKFSDKKISPILFKEIVDGKVKGITTLRVTCIGNRIPAEFQRDSFVPEKVFSSDKLTVFSVTGSVQDVLQSLLQSDQVVFIEHGSRIPKEELQVNRLDLSVNKINLVHRKFPAWKGDGLVVSVKENKPDTADIDFAGRFLSTYLSSSIFSTHASIMATMIAGAGNSWHLGKGAAWGSRISSSDFRTLLPDPDAAYRQYNISIQNHSYGVGVENFYGSDAALYDQSAINNPKLLHIFSSGNSGTSSSSTGDYIGLAGFANLTGSFKMAKNILTVGATDSFSLVEQLSSKGPAYDGRVKPELVAFGEDGSSGAAALVSGTSLILQEAYRDLYDSLPSNALVKAILLNSADDAGNKEVDYATGFGSLNAEKAVSTIHAGHFSSGTVNQDGEQIFNLIIPAGIKKCKITLVWNDPPAIPNAAYALINDLDIELVNNITGDKWLPWVLSSYPLVDSLIKPAERRRDSLNNIEQITMEEPVHGSYRIFVKGTRILRPQEFYLAYQFDSTEVFEWEFPTALNFVSSGVSNTIRWNPVSETGHLEFSMDSGSTWTSIRSGLDLSSGFYRWNTPAVISKALLRMTVGSSAYLSDTFTISERTITGVGFNCPDSILFYWSKLAGVQNYRVYALGETYLEPIAVTSDSLIIISKNVNSSLHYAVAPLISGKEGMRSYTFDYSSQGVECYIRSFLGSIDINNEARLDLQLGTLYGVNKIVLEKQMDGRFAGIETIQNPVSLQLSFIDGKVLRGLNIYRVKLELSGGAVIYSLTETVYNLMESSFIIYPNPVPRFQPVNILTSNDILSEINLQVYDSYGRLMMRRPLKNFSEQIPTDQFSKGIYIFRFMVEGEKDRVMKVVVR